MCVKLPRQHTAQMVTQISTGSVPAEETLHLRPQLRNSWRTPKAVQTVQASRQVSKPLEVGGVLKAPELADGAPQDVGGGLGVSVPTDASWALAHGGGNAGSSSAVRSSGPTPGDWPTGIAAAGCETHPPHTAERL